jgi:hypothetical protein
VATRSVAIGLKAAWQTFRQPNRQSEASQAPQSQSQTVNRPSSAEPRLAASNSRFEVDPALTADRFDEEDFLEDAAVSVPLREQEQHSTTEPQSASKISRQSS